VPPCSATKEVGDDKKSGDFQIVNDEYQQRKQKQRKRVRKQQVQRRRALLAGSWISVKIHSRFRRALPARLNRKLQRLYHSAANELHNDELTCELSAETCQSMIETLCTLQDKKGLQSEASAGLVARELMVLVISNLSETNKNWTSMRASFAPLDCSPATESGAHLGDRVSTLCGPIVMKRISLHLKVSFEPRRATISHDMLLGLKNWYRWPRLAKWLLRSWKVSEIAVGLSEKLRLLNRDRRLYKAKEAWTQQFILCLSVDDILVALFVTFVLNRIVHTKRPQSSPSCCCHNKSKIETTLAYRRRARS